MARTEARIFTSIWRDEDFIALPPDAQRLYMFLLSQHDLNYCGVLPLLERRWATKAAGLTLEDIERDLKILEAPRDPTGHPSVNPTPNPSGNPSGEGFQVSLEPSFLVIDWDTGEVLIRAFIRRDGLWKQPNLLKQARDTATQIESPRIRAALLEELKRLPLDESASALVKSVVSEFINDLATGSPHLFVYPSANPTPDPSGNPNGKGSAKGSQEKGEGYGSTRQGPPVLPNSVTPSAEAPENHGASASPKRSPRRGTRLPEDFTVTPEMAAWAAGRCPHADIALATEMFINYWVSASGKNATKHDWTRAWRNWLLKDEQDASRPRGPGSRRQSGIDGLFADANARAEAREAAARLRVAR